MGYTSKEQKLQSIIELERELNEIKDVDLLLERLLTESRKIVHADAGSIYVLEDNILKIKYAQNDTELKNLQSGNKNVFTYFSFPVNETSIVGYSVSHKCVVNVSDAYTIPKDNPYHFNSTSDKQTGYKTQSILTIPLITSNDKVLGVLQIINAQDEDGNFIPFDNDAELYLKHYASTATQVLERAYLTRAMVMRMIKMSEFRDPKETGSHVERVSNYAVEIYDRWSFEHNIPKNESDKYRDSLKIAAMLHDVGKVCVSDLILKKPGPGRLSEQEFEAMKAHTYIGSMLFSSFDSYLDKMAFDVALRHHEHWDGNGYPGHIDYKNLKDSSVVLSLKDINGLKGEEIPLSARIVALADVYDALSCHRVYKEPWAEEDVLNEIKNQAGKHFDPELVSIFFYVLPLLKEIQKQWPDN